MLLAAVVDAAAATGMRDAVATAVSRAVASLRVEPIGLTFREVRRHGFRATKADVEVAPATSERTVADVLDLVARAGLAPAVEVFARGVFTLLGEAEARVHGEDPTTIHLHEVGALDALADVIGCATALGELGLLDDRARIVVGPVALGSGSARSSHGSIPIPAPAVLEILMGSGATVTDGGTQRELCTPTGAALLARLADAWGPLPAMRIDAVGLGAGAADRPDRANVLRVVLGEAAGTSTGGPWRHDDLLEVEATVDDLDPRLWPDVLDGLVEAGALDAWLSPVVMRKGRPGHVVTALTPEPTVDAVARALFTGSTTLGLRVRPVVRQALPRDEVIVDVDGCAIRVKRGLLDGEAITVQPEYADAARAAKSLGRPVRWVLDRAGALSRARSESPT